VIHVIGGGLAGCEAAWQAARRGRDVTLHEMRPVRPTLVHKTDHLAELVCSNSFRGDKLDNAVGLIKEEMRRLDSLIMAAAEVARVPAGAALAVDREAFSREVMTRLAAEPRIRVVREEVAELPAPRPCDQVIVATGPLTSDALSRAIQQFVGDEHLAFYDAISPIVLAESIDMSVVFRQSRWGRSLRRPADVAAAAVPAPAAEPAGAGVACGIDDGEGDYLNCPFTKAQYDAFYDALVTAESATVHDFDSVQFFEGCLPIEVMAHRGRDTLRFGPMKPVGLEDPKTGRRPYAAVQLRQDTLAGDHFSLVGFQTQLKWGEQARVLRLVPGLEHAEFVRFGMVHRNTFICGVEGYVESAASGLIAGINAARLADGQPPVAPPRTTALGSLAYYASHADPKHYQPSNITFGIMPPLDQPPRDKALRKQALADRALADLAAFTATL